MATFLELCQEVARESGTIAGGGLPASVENQSGRLLKIVNWTARAWERIQNDRGSWRFLQAEFENKQLTAGTARYTAASFNLADWAEWIGDNAASGHRPLSLYALSLGVADEGELVELDWAAWRVRYTRGQQEPGRPVCYAVSPAGELCFGPVPDATYVVRGEYRRRPQVLVANGDVPLLPERFHRIIVWRALMLLAEHDEAVRAAAMARGNYNEMLFALQRDQLPTIHIGAGALA